MTREEAITNLNMISVAFVEPVTTHQRKLIDDTFEMAIKALSQEPCEDVVSRKAVYQLLMNMASSAYGFEEIRRIVDELPSVTQKSGWIPVSERLPEDAYGCLVTVYDTDLRTQDEFENILPYFVGYDGETWNNADGEPISFEVIAWMPLPPSYQGK